MAAAASSLMALHGKCFEPSFVLGDDDSWDSWDSPQVQEHVQDKEPLQDPPQVQEHVQDEEPLQEEGAKEEDPGDAIRY